MKHENEICPVCGNPVDAKLIEKAIAESPFEPDESASFFHYDCGISDKSFEPDSTFEKIGVLWQDNA